MSRDIVIRRYGKMLILAVVCFGVGYTLNIKLQYNPNLTLSFQEVFVNNVSVNYKAVFLGIITGGIYSVYYIASEMFFLGVVIKGVAIQKSLLYALAFIGCHGILEIPTIVLAGMIGVNFVQGMIRVVKKNEHIKNVFRSTLILIVILFVLIVLSAVVETQITTRVVRKMIM